MAHGDIHATRHADVHGVRHAGALTLAGGMATVTRDGTSLKYVPSTNAEWTTTMTVAGQSGNPSSLYLCQEASGNMGDTIGSLPLVVNSTPGYRQPITGWTRLGMTFADGSTQRFGVNAGSGPNPNTTSQAWLWYLAITATPAGTRTAALISNGGVVYQITVTTTPNMRITTSAPTTGTANPTLAGIMPVLLVYDRANSVANLYTGQEKIVGTYTATVADGFKGVGGVGAASIPGQVVYGAMWSGAAAERSEANWKTILQTLGWVIPW